MTQINLSFHDRSTPGNPVKAYRVTPGRLEQIANWPADLVGAEIARDAQGRVVGLRVHQWEMDNFLALHPRLKELIQEVDELAGA